MSEKKVVFIFGPTGVGKTDLAVDVAMGIGEIISVDSMQVYRGLDCGTAKPTNDQLRKVKHHLVNIVSPEYRFSAGDFMRLALKAIEEIHKKNRVAFLVGGTGLYFRALEYNLSDAPPADMRLRRNLYREEEKEKGILYERLREVDPKTAGTLHPNDLIRIVRALEIYLISGMRFSDFINQESPLGIRALKIGINMNRDDLYRRLEERCTKMIENGLAGEVYRLVNEGCTEKLPSMKGLGYSHFIQYFKGCRSYQETVRLFMRDTRRYAKRQLTWFRKEEGTFWWSPGDSDIVRQTIYSFIGRCKS